MQRQSKFIILVILTLLFYTIGGSSWAGLPQQAKAQTTGVTFTYQGQLDQGDAPAQGSCDFQFKLYKAIDDNGQPIDTDEDLGISVDNGLFTAKVEDIDFGVGAFTQQERWLEIGVRCPAGLGDYKNLNPRQRIMLVPAAAYALTTAPVPWSNLTDVPPGLTDGDNDTTYAAGSGLELTNGAFHVVTGTIQSRIIGICPDGSGIRAINADGAVACEPDDNTVKSVDPTLVLNNGQLGVNTSAIQKRVTGTCSFNNSIRTINADGTVACEPDNDTTYGAGNGLGLINGVFSLNYYDRGGLTVNNAGWDGFTSRNPAASGLYVENAQIDGVHISNPVGDGIQVNNPGNVGAEIHNVGETGVFVDGARLHGIEIMNAGDYAGVFRGRVWINGICQGCTAAAFGLNISTQILKPGDVVTVRNISQLNFQEQPLLEVDLATPQDAVIGVVYNRAELKETSTDGRTTNFLVPRTGPAQPGEYISIITSGMAQVKTSAIVTPIRSGALLITANQPGQARPLDAEARASGIDRTGTVIGTALEGKADVQGLVWVLVNPR